MKSRQATTTAMPANFASLLNTLSGVSIGMVSRGARNGGRGVAQVAPQSPLAQRATLDGALAQTIHGLSFWLDLYQISLAGLENALQQARTSFPGLAGLPGGDGGEAQTGVAGAVSALLAAAGSSAPPDQARPAAGPAVAPPAQPQTNALVASPAAAAGTGAPATGSDRLQVLLEQLVAASGLGPTSSIAMAQAPTSPAAAGPSAAAATAPKPAAAVAAAPAAAAAAGKCMELGPRGTPAAGQSADPDSVLPGWSTLASKEPSDNSSGGGTVQVGQAPSAAPVRAAKRQRTEGKGSARVCSNCGSTDTPFWRRDPDSGQPLCNACGLYLSKNSHARPVNLWREGQGSMQQQQQQPGSAAPQLQAQVPAPHAVPPPLFAATSVPVPAALGGACAAASAGAAAGAVAPGGGCGNGTGSSLQAAAGQARQGQPGPSADVGAVQQLLLLLQRTLGDAPPAGVALQVDAQVPAKP